MRLSWSQHLAAARTLELAGREETGTALGLMGMALLMLLQDLQSAGETESSDTKPA
jgi:membrane protease subunit (stomatin/prohibitin family)